MMNWSVLVVLCLVTLSNVEVEQSQYDGKYIIIITSHQYSPCMNGLQLCGLLQLCMKL